MNIKNILSEGISILQKNKIPNPQLDSQILLSNSITLMNTFLAILILPNL